MFSVRELGVTWPCLVSFEVDSDSVTCSGHHLAIMGIFREGSGTVL